ncbi:uncharacterized protein LOC122385444 [Amphibalanus amphitrite]|uniref:uncharacterized protein LOC122385444 n=1 Tax=Amphibalanus amphitrite TaxID=1232801 RepID=UPI001C91C0F3|nr:uncharacterized protein LOC122385444 [Amphibalanus amphitrite]
MSATGETEQPPAADLEESVLREERNEGVSEELKVLRRKRGQKLAAFSRVCHRAESIIAVRGSRSTLEGLYATVDAALEGIITANDALEACLSSEADKADAEEYCAKAERDREDIVERITQHLAERKDEPPSETGSVVSVAQKSQTSAVSRASQVEAEVASKIKALRLQQLKRRQEEQRLQENREEEKQRRRQEEQRQEREAERRRQLQDAEDEAEAAQLEADLRRELNDDLQHERRNDFEDELFATKEAGIRSHQREVQLSRDRPATAPSHEMEERREEPVKGSGSHQMRQNTSWIGELRSSRQTQRTESAAPFSAFAKSIPKLTLPTFSGKASEWPRWSGLFKALVHDQPSLSDTEKIAHLQSSVSGLAQQTISGMLYDGSLYHQALKALEERFGQDDDIIKHNLNSIFNAPDPMEDDAEALERFQATVHCAVTILHSMGADADLHSSDSLHRTVEKLPRDLRREWGKFSLELKPTRPSLLDVDSWLKTQVKISRSCPKGKGNGEEVGARQRKERADEIVQRQTFFTAANPKHKQMCSACEGQHDLQQCQIFIGKSPDVRLEHAFNQRLCLYCLRKGHRVADCGKARRCESDGCKYRHHALLHGSRPVRSRQPDDSVAKPESGSEGADAAAPGAVPSLLPEPAQQVMFVQSRVGAGELLSEQEKEWRATGASKTKHSQPVPQSPTRLQHAAGHAAARPRDPGVTGTRWMSPFCPDQGGRTMRE